uniref:IS110 family transposase n=1 Tax=Paenibacillus lautus TaxID=1401 RepID=UPI0026B73D47
MLRAVSFHGIAFGAPLEFGNRLESFKIFGRWIQDLIQTCKLDKVIIGMEPTGHYWLNLARRLSSQHIEAVLVNTHLVKRIRRTVTTRHLKVTAKMLLSLQTSMV